MSDTRHPATVCQAKLGIHSESPGLWLDVWAVLQLASQRPQVEGHTNAVDATLAVLDANGIKAGSFAYHRLEKSLSSLRSKLIQENDLRQWQRERLANG